MNHKASTLIARLDRLPIWPYPMKLLWVVGIGFFFAFFDIISIALALPRIETEFGISLTTASWSITSSLLGYIIGSFLIARISDRYGRRLALYISIAFFSIGSLFTTFSMHFGAIILWRFITGIGIGAEISEVSTYLAELSPKACRGRYSTLGVAFGFFGFAIVPFIALLLIPNFTWGWRAMFFIGAIGGIVIFFMRRNMPDSPRWLLAHNQVIKAEKIITAAEARVQLKMPLPPINENDKISISLPKHQFLAMFHKPYGGRLILFVAIWFIYYIGNYAWLTLAPNLFYQHGYSLTTSLTFTAIASMGFVVGALLASFLGDKLERKYLISFAGVVWIIALLCVGWLTSEKVIMICGFTAAATIGFMVPLMYAYTTEHFPLASRATSVALTDGLGHLGAAFSSQIILSLAACFTNSFAAAFTIMAVTGVLTLILLAFGKRMTQQSLSS